MISDLDAKKLNQFIQNYRHAGKTEGGIYTLAELLKEQGRRVETPFPPREVAKIIVAKAKQSDDGLVTYKDLWDHFRPGEPWKGNASQQIMAKALARVIVYCADHKLPVLTTLVVRSGNRTLSEEAILNIYNEAKALGFEVGLVPSEFVFEQRELAIGLLEASLPE